MSNEVRCVEAIEDLNEQDWEVPGINYDIPLLGYDPTEEEKEENDEIRKEVTEAVLEAFESFNQVYLEGDARQYFLDSMEDYYGL